MRTSDVPLRWLIKLDGMSCFLSFSFVFAIGAVEISQVEKEKSDNDAGNRTKDCMNVDLNL